MTAVFDAGQIPKADRAEAGDLTIWSVTSTAVAVHHTAALTLVPQRDAAPAGAIISQFVDSTIGMEDCTPALLDRSV